MLQRGHVAVRISIQRIRYALKFQNEAREKGVSLFIRFVFSPNFKNLLVLDAGGGGGAWIELITNIFQKIM
jgi:hypothetical protein